MPRAGLSTDAVVAAGADLADEHGIDAVTFAALAGRLGVQAPALYKHVDGVADLRRRIATLAMTEVGDALRDRLQGASGVDALTALLSVLRGYATDHPGRYMATVGVPFAGDDDPLLRAATRVIESVRAALSSYGLPPGEVDHAIRTVRCLLHGLATLQAADGFQWANDPDETVEWMVGFVDAGLTAAGSAPAPPGR